MPPRQAMGGCPGLPPWRRARPCFGAAPPPNPRRRGAGRPRPTGPREGGTGALGDGRKGGLSLRASGKPPVCRERPERVPLEGGGGEATRCQASYTKMAMKRESQCAEPLALRRLGAVGVAVRVFGSCWLPVSCSAPSGDVTSDGRGEQVGPRRVGVCHVQICSGRTAAANKSSRGGCVCVLHSCESAVESEGRRGGRAS